MSKTIKLKTKLKAADCAAYLNQFTAESDSGTKPLTGWVANKSFELAPSHAGLFSIQSVGNISEGTDGATVHLKVQMSRSSKRILTITACLILGAFAALVPSYMQDMDVFGFSWAFLFLVVVPAAVWIAAFIAIRRSVQSKQDPFVNTLCSSLQAQKVQTITENLPSIVLERAKGKSIQSGKIVSAVWLTLHAIPFLAGFGVANYLTDYLHNRAWNAWVNGNYAESESYCRPIMQVTELFYSGDQSRQAYAYYILAENLRCQGKLDEALEFYNKAKALQEKTLDRDNPILAWTYDNIGKIYDAQNNPQAVDYYSKAIDIWKKSNPPQEALIARSLNRLALYHAKQGDPTQLELAEQEQLDALSRDSQSFPLTDGRKSMTVAEDLNDLAVIYLAGSKFKSAEKLLNESIDIKESHNKSEENKIRLANSYTNLYFAKSGSKGVGEMDRLMLALKLHNPVITISGPPNKYFFQQIIEKLRPSTEFPNTDRRSDVRFDYLWEPDNKKIDSQYRLLRD